MHVQVQSWLGRESAVSIRSSESIPFPAFDGYTLLRCVVVIELTSHVPAIWHKISLSRRSMAAVAQFYSTSSTTSNKMAHLTLKKKTFQLYLIHFRNLLDNPPRTTNFDTHHHSHHDISLLVPEFPHSKPEDSTHNPWILLSPWLDLISSS